MIPSLVAAVAATAAAKRSNAAYEERRREEDEKARKRWQEEERRRYEWQRATKIVDALMQTAQQAESLEQWLASIRSRGPLQRKTGKLVQLVEQRLEHLREQLRSDELERRLAREYFFADD